MKESKGLEPKEAGRASTPEEIRLAEELIAVRDTIADEKTKAEFAGEEFTWLCFLKRPDIQRFIDAKLVIPVRGKNGEFEKVEIRDPSGNLIFYSNNKGFDELVRRANGWDKIN